MNYVVGFAFTLDGSVALIRKIKPAWQAGKFNGIGGKIEEYDPSPVHAMTREFQEETGVFIEPHLWREVGALYFDDDVHEKRGTVHIFSVVDPMIQFVATSTAEEVFLKDALWCYENPDQLVPNLMTMIHASLIRPNENDKRPFVTLDYSKAK